MLKKFNHRGELSMFLFNRLALRDISTTRMRMYEATQGVPLGFTLDDRAEAVAETVDVLDYDHDGLVDEGQLWSQWQVDGSLRRRVSVPYELNTTGRADRGLVVCRMPHGHGTTWHRSNILRVDGINLATRTLSQVRSNPWELDLVDFDRPLCAVLVDLNPVRIPDADRDGMISSDDDRLQLMLVDGGAKLVAGDLDRSVDNSGEPLLGTHSAHFRTGSGVGCGAERWEMVGCLIGTPTRNHGDLCAKVTLPSTTLLKMQVFPVEALRRLVGLMRSQTDRDGAHAECIVVNPNEHFLMIPLTLGVLKRTDNGSSKVVEFLGLSSIHQFVGVDHDDTDRSGDDSWASCLLPAAVADHDCGLTAAEVSSLRTLSRLKPCYHQASHIPREGVSKELLPTGVARLWDETLRWRQVQGLSTHGLHFVDLGSGIGGVVIATQVLHPTFVTSGVEKDADLHDTTM